MTVDAGRPPAGTVDTGRPPPSRGDGRRDLAVCLLLVAGAVAVNLASVAAVGTGQVLSGEEASVSIRDVVALPTREQASVWATNAGGHVHYWVFSHLDPAPDLFYGRRWKALATALLAPLVYLTLRRRLGCAPGPAALAGATAVALPGVSALAWLATENGLEAVWGLAALLLVTSRRRGWWLAPVLAGVSVSTYGAGLAWAAAVLAVAAVRLARPPRPLPARTRLREGALLAVAVGGGVAVVLAPALWWWRDGGRVVVGGGSVETADPGAALRHLAGELVVRGDSYYFFSDAPALGSPVLAVALLGAVVLAPVLRPRLWPWTLVAVAALAVYAASGGVLGVRRAVAVPVVAALACGVLADAAARALRRRWRRVLLAGVAAAVLVPLVVQHAAWRADWAAGRLEVPRDFAFPVGPGRTMPEEVDALGRRLRSGELSPERLARRWEGERTLAMVWLLAERRGEDVSGLPAPRRVVEMLHEGPRCVRDCRPVPGRR